MNKIPLIIGLGKTGVSLAKYLAKSAETLYILESSPNNKYLKELKDLDIHYILNPEISEKTFKLISSVYPSPGVSMEHDSLRQAKSLNIPIQTDMDIYLKFSQSYNILVTGTNGKTTTVSMLEHLLRGFMKEKSISAIGNIGKPVLDCLDQKIDIAVHALKDMPSIETKGLLTNCFLKRNDPREILISKNNKNIMLIESNSIIGTSSFRREFQLKKILP